MSAIIQTIEADGCGTTWLAAAQAVAAAGGEAYHLVLGVRSPATMRPVDVAIQRALDEFLVAHDSEPVSTVAGTIFPLGPYLHGGASELFHVFPKYAPKLKGRWEGYAVRMLSKSLTVKGVEVSPLERLVQQMRTHASSGKRALYELSIDDPNDPLLDLAIHDARKDGGSIYPPCLMHVSVKIVKKRVVLTALYRSHYYVQKLLGNLLGLAQLQLFLTEQLGVDYEPGPLICHSTYATFDTGRRAWTKTEARALLKRCEEIQASYSSKTTTAIAYVPS